MHIESTSRQLPFDPLANDGWLGTPEFPGYRANNVVVRLDHEPRVDPEHLYFHLLVLDANGQLQDNHSGPCLALARHQSLQERIRFVRVVAELVRFAPNEERGLSAIGQALTLVRESGVDHDSLLVVAQVFDDVCSEETVTASLIRLLKLSLGVHDTTRAIHDVVVGLARSSNFDAEAADLGISAAEVRSKAMPLIASGLHVQMSYIVRTVGKSHARRYLRGLVGSELVPLPHMLGV